jgi:glycosyltransferase involved in cell wall biosynthesis
MGSLDASASARPVVHLTSVHPAYDNRIFWKECASLAEAGHDVCLIAPMAQSGAGRTANRVKIIGIKRRSGRLARMTLSTIAVAAAAVRTNAALYHFHDPELLPVGLVLRLLGKPVIYDVHEDVPRDILFKDWIPRPWRGVVSSAAAASEWLAARLLSGIVAATPVIAARFPAGRVALVQNFARMSEFAAHSGPSVAARRAVAYVGSITKDRGAFDMVAAMGRVEKYPDVRLILAGEISPHSLATDLAHASGWCRVDYRGYQDRAGVQRVFSEARVGLAVLHPIRTFIDAQPTKLFEYMAAGIPVIASDFPRFREIVERNGCGLWVPSRDVGAITSAIEWMFDHPAEAERMGRRGQDAVQQHFSWEKEAETLLGVYDQILGTQRLGGCRKEGTCARKDKSLIFSFRAGSWHLASGSIGPLGTTSTDAALVNLAEPEGRGNEGAP